MKASDNIPKEISPKSCCERPRRPPNDPVMWLVGFLAKSRSRCQEISEGLEMDDFVGDETYLSTGSSVAVLVRTARTSHSKNVNTRTCRGTERDVVRRQKLAFKRNGQPRPADVEANRS